MLRLAVHVRGWRRPSRATRMRSARRYSNSAKSCLPNRSSAQPKLTMAAAVSTWSGPSVRNAWQQGFPRFSIDGATLYFADSPTLQIRKYAYSASGPLEDRGVFAQLDPDTGIPDGSCIDADNALWNTQYGGGLTQRYLADGSRDLQVELPVSQVTCCCFGGPDYSRLYISTAAQRLSVDARATQPLAGGIFVCEPGVNGVAEDGFAGDAFALAR